jgi:hypothetical protein
MLHTTPACPVKSTRKQIWAPETTPGPAKVTVIVVEAPLARDTAVVLGVIVVLAGEMGVSVIPETAKPESFVTVTVYAKVPLGPQLVAGSLSTMQQSLDVATAT